MKPTAIEPKQESRLKTKERLEIDPINKHNANDSRCVLEKAPEALLSKKPREPSVASRGQHMLQYRMHARVLTLHFWLLWPLLAALPDHSVADQERAAGSLSEWSPEVLSLPGRPGIRIITAQNGQSVLLHCLVEAAGDLGVSWFRGASEPQLLTYELNTVVDDERFVVRRGLMADDDWALQIKNLDKAADSGLYQCQTHSEPPRSQFYQLNIVEPQAHILGAPDLAVKLGAAINLTCVISQAPDQVRFIFWYRDHRVINYDMNDRGKIVISQLNNTDQTVTSNLQIFHSRLTDSGNYTCMPPGAGRPTSIYVHVLEGSDKRLIMFQNDHWPPAASSQQTNSAVSVHVVRLSRGRAYAFFVAFVIFSAWYQLVAQTQTLISLLLLAIIGFFIGKVTEQLDEPPEAKQASRLMMRALASGAGLTLHQHRTDQFEKPAPKSRTCSDANSTISTSRGVEEEEETDDMEEHSRHLGSALHLLAGSPTSSRLPIKGRRLDALPVASAAAGAAHATTSPSPSSPAPSASASSSSTGYNSDSRNDSTNGRPPEEGVPLEADMIELVSKPSALKLMMDQFSCARRQEEHNLDKNGSEPIAGDRGAPALRISEKTPGKPRRRVVVHTGSLLRPGEPVPGAWLEPSQDEQVERHPAPDGARQRRHKHQLQYSSLTDDLEPHYSTPVIYSAPQIKSPSVPATGCNAKAGHLNDSIPAADTASSFSLNLAPRGTPIPNQAQAPPAACNLALERRTDASESAASSEPPPTSSLLDGCGAA